MCDYCALSVKLDFQDTELLVSIFPFLVDACKDLVSCKCISLQMHFSAVLGAGGQRRSSGLLGDPHPLSVPWLWRWGGWRRLEGQRDPCAQRWALPPAGSPGAAAERGAVVVLRRSPCRSHTRYLVGSGFFGSVRCLCNKVSGASVTHQSPRAGGD